MIDARETLRRTILNVTGKSGITPLARPILGGVGAILMLHSVTSKPRHPKGFNRHLTIAPEFLDAALAAIRGDGYDLVSMDDVASRLETGRFGRRFVAITLDDGFRDNLTEALLVFEKHDAPFAIYAAPAMIDGAIDLWWEIVEEVVLKRDLVYLTTPGGRVALDCSSPRQKLASGRKLTEYLTMDVAESDQQNVVREIARDAGVDFAKLMQRRLLNWDELRGLAAHPLATIGAHTVTHRNLARLSEDAARSEIREAARIIKSELGFAPVHMAYPYGYSGAVGKREVALAKEAGFRTAVTTRHGVIRAAHRAHMTALPRISVNGRFQDVAQLRAMIAGITTPLANSGRLLATI